MSYLFRTLLISSLVFTSLNLVAAEEGKNNIADIKTYQRLTKHEKQKFLKDLSIEEKEKLINLFQAKQEMSSQLDTVNKLEAEISLIMISI